MAKNLIALVDGTMVSASRTEGYSSYSNVFELACLLQLQDRSVDGSPQMVFYSSGISSRPDTSSLYNLVTGNSIKSQIVDQYTNICANFDFARADEGNADKIFLFGFSRGAMAVRALAGLIAEFGLLRPRDIRHLPTLLDRWERSLGRGSLPDHINLKMVVIEFIGVFDSVMGGVESLPIFNPIRFSNASLPSRCKHGVQILAIDENRRFFRPKPWEGVLESRTASGHRGSGSYLRQIWMPGVHSDIGGTGDAIWGRASLLAMTYYITKLTDLRLDSAWLSEKESKLRYSIDDNRIFIKLHKGPLARHVRLPSPKPETHERLHPVCRKIRFVYYDGHKAYDWPKRVLDARFNSINVDEDIESYFCRVLDIPSRSSEQSG